MVPSTNQLPSGGTATGTPGTGLGRGGGAVCVPAERLPQVTPPEATPTPAPTTPPGPYSQPNPAGPAPGGSTGAFQPQGPGGVPNPYGPGQNSYQNF
jgi:hypothetical protein